jgi:hypothetical protein
VKTHTMNGATRLPDSVQEIADVIGREQALLLIGALPRCYVGQPGKKSHQVVMYVPTVKNLRADHQLVRILGRCDAEKLCRAFGGEIMKPANCACIERAFLHQSVLDMMRGGAMKAAHVAAIVGVHERTVRNLVRENPPEDGARALRDNAGDVNRKARPMIPIFAQCAA